MILIAECGGCGSTEESRKRFLEKQGEVVTYSELMIKACPHCDADKCCICDMGNDTNCITCDNAHPND